MVLRLATADRRRSAFTLVEVMVAFAIFGLIAVGVLYGYVQTNRMSEWSALSLAAQSYASQGAEQARAADWSPYSGTTNKGPGTADEWTNFNSNVKINCGSNYIMDIPIKGDPTATDFAFFVTNYVWVTNISANPPLRQIRSDAVWTFYLTRTVYTNTIILLRAGDQ